MRGISPVKKIFINGGSGTTGLKIADRLAGMDDIELLRLPEAQRRDPVAKSQAMNASDVTFLCLPDAAAEEDVALLQNPDTILIDTSTAHRVHPAWTYGFPELSSAHEERVRRAVRIATPGCHASGFIALIYPLLAIGILPQAAALTCHSVTGYSGGGKSMIGDYEAGDRSELLGAPRQYGLSQAHKHLPEMQHMTGLETPPLFCPVVSDFYAGMVVTVPLFAHNLTAGRGPEDIRQCYESWYRGPVVRYAPEIAESGFISAAVMSGRDAMRITVCGNEERILLIAQYDNLGKGASGAAIQCMNLALGREVANGLIL